MIPIFEVNGFDTCCFGPYHWNLFNIESEAITILSNDHDVLEDNWCNRYDTVLLVFQFSVLS